MGIPQFVVESSNSYIFHSSNTRVRKKISKNICFQHLQVFLEQYIPDIKYNFLFDIPFVQTFSLIKVFLVVGKNITHKNETLDVVREVEK